MAFTGKSYNLLGSGIVTVAMAAEAPKRLLILGDSTTSEAVAHRFWEAWVCRSTPVQFNGFFTSAYMAGADWSEKSNSLPTNFTASVSTQLDPTSISYTGTGYTIGADSVLSGPAIGLADGMTVWIEDASAPNVNGVHLITAVGGGGANTFKGSPAIDTTGESTDTFTIRRILAVFPNLVSGLAPTLTSSWQWGATAVADNAALTSFTVHPYQAGSQTAYSHSANVTDPEWWMAGIDASLIYFDPKLSVHGCTGANFDIYTCRLAESPAKNGATVQHGDGGVVRVETRSITATTDGRKVPQLKIYNAPAGGALATDNRNTQILPWGAMFERTTRTKGLTVIPWGNAQWSAGDWGDSTGGPLAAGMPNDTVLSEFFALVPVDGVVIHVGFNLTAAQIADLDNPSTTVMKASLAADITRIRSVAGNVPILLITPYRYHRPIDAGGTVGANATVNATIYQAIVDAMKETCDEISRVGMVNIYSNLGDNITFIDDAGDMNPVTGGSSDRHPNENGSAFFIGFVWQQIRAAYQTMRGGGAGSMGIGI